MDASVNDVYGEEIKAIVANMKDVHGILELKTRQIGQKIWAELDILVDTHCSLAEGEMIAEKVRTRLMNKINDLERVMVHFGPLEHSEC